MVINKQLNDVVGSGGSRISRWRGGGGADLRHGHFSVKTFAKAKELDPVGRGGMRRRHPLDPPWLGHHFVYSGIPGRHG